ncbi:MAG: hypothetical protein Crog4KO_08360 [Crocinitomicaceae bacterium]
MKKTLLKSLRLSVVAIGLAGFSASAQTDCNDPDNIKHVKVNIHYLLKSDGTGNFHEMGDGWGNPNYTGFDYAEDMIDSINTELNVNPGIRSGMQVPGYDYTVTDFGFRFVLAGVHFHRNTTLYDAMDTGYDEANAGSSLWDMSYMPAYDVNPSSEINIYIVSSPSFGNTGVFQGVASLNGFRLQVFNCWLTYKYGHQNWGAGTPPSELHRFESRTIAHELGHNLGLRHAYQWDGIPDTKQLGYSCWQHTATGPCSDWNNITNNLMDYNGYDDYALSPLQIEAVRNNLNAGKSNYVQQCSNCDVAHANLYVPETQCLPIYIDGTASQNDHNHFLEIVEVDPNNGNATVSGTYYSSWFTGEINRINDLGAYTGYNFIHGKRYRIKLAVQSYDGSGGFCTPWDQTEFYYVDINDGATCCQSGLQLHTFYDIQQECITYFQAASSCPDASITHVTFQIGSTTYTDNEPTYIFYMPASAAFTGTVYATFYFNDGTSTTVSIPYQKCVTDPMEGNPGGYRNMEGNLKGQLSIYPNPSKGRFTVQNVFDTNVNATLYSGEGRVLAEAVISAHQSKEMDLSDLSSGTYLIRFTSGEELLEKRIVIID